MSPAVEDIRGRVWRCREILSDKPRPIVARAVRAAMHEAEREVQSITGKKAQKARQS